MFKILATVCFLSVGINNQNLCMQGYIPTNQPLESEQHCLVTIKEISEYVNEDFLKREIGIYLQCVKEETNHVNI